MTDLPNTYPPEWWYTGDRVEPDCDCSVTWPRERTDGMRYWAICTECGDTFDADTPRHPYAKS